MNRPASHSVTVVAMLGVLCGCSAASTNEEVTQATPQNDKSFHCDPGSYPEHFTDWPAAHPHYEGETTPWPEDSLDREPKRISSPPLEYPYANHVGRWEGWVLLESVVEDDGAVKFVELLDAEVWHVGEERSKPKDTGSLRAAAAFARVAQELLTQSEFAAGERQGEAVPALICIPITFKLLDGGGRAYVRQPLSDPVLPRPAN